MPTMTLPRYAALLLSLVLVHSSAQGQIQLPGEERPSLAPLLRDVTPSVVNIAVVTRTTATRNPLNPFFDDPFFRRFFEFPQNPESIPRQSAGSGVIIDAEQGYVLTNHHVIENAEEIVVTLQDRRTFDAELVGSDSGTDIAMLRIEADELTAIEIGDSNSLEVGDFVIAIGNPFGLGQTVTSGIVSALGRTGLGIVGSNADQPGAQAGYEYFIQTDASINPGNSGGALIDLDGQLVGINTAIVSPAGGNVGIGFAVPVAMAGNIVEQLLEYGEIQRGRLGIFIQDVTPDLSEALDLGVDRGALVNQIEPGSAAERAGLREGDVITELDGEQVEGAADLRNRVALVRVGTEVELSFIRDGRRETLRAAVGGAPEIAAAEGPAEGQTIDRLRGAEFRDLDPAHPRYGTVAGVLVANVAQGSPAALNGLRPGDIIMAVNRRPVSSVSELSVAMRETSGTFALNVLRDNARLFIVIQ